MKKKGRGRPAGKKSANGSVKKKKSAPESEFTCMPLGKSDAYAFILNGVKIMTRVKFTPNAVVINGVDCDIKDVMLSLRRIGKKYAE